MTPGRPRSDRKVDPLATRATPVRWRRRVDAGWRATANGLVLLPAERPDPVTVAGSAVAVWELLDQPITQEVLAERLAARYEQDPDRIGHDLEPLLADLLELGAIEAAD